MTETHAQQPGGALHYAAHDGQPKRMPSPVRNPAVDVHPFLRAVPDMVGADAKVAGVRASLKSTQALIRSLRGAAADAAAVLTYDTGDGAANQLARTGKWTSSEDAMEWEHAVHAVEAAVAELRFKDALTRLKVLDAHVVKAGKAVTMQNMPQAKELPWRMQVRAADLSQRTTEALKNRMAAQHLSSAEVRATTAQLADVAGIHVALEALLALASRKLREELNALPLVAQAGATGPAAEAAAVDLAAAMGQAVAEAVAGAYGDALASLSPEQLVHGMLVDWGLGEVRSACDQLRRLVILPLASPAGPRSTCACAAAFLAYCHRLSADCSLPAAVVALDALWPAIDVVVQRRLRQLVEGLRKAALAEGKAAAAGSVPLPSLEGCAWEALASVYPSAAKMLAELTSMATDISTVAGPKAVVAFRQGVSDLFTVRANDRF